jgi:hypothetical protein
MLVIRPEQCAHFRGRDRCKTGVETCAGEIKTKSGMISMWLGGDIVRHKAQNRLIYQGFYKLNFERRRVKPCGIFALIFLIPGWRQISPPDSDPGSTGRGTLSWMLRDRTSVKQTVPIGTCFVCFTHLALKSFAMFHPCFIDVSACFGLFRYSRINNVSAEKIPPKKANDFNSETFRNSAETLRR